MRTAAIWQTIKRNRKLVREQLRAADVSLAPIDRYLRPKLGPEQAAKRLKRAKERKNRTVGSLRSDECSVERLDDVRQVWVFRTLSEEWKTERITPKKGDKEFL